MSRSIIAVTALVFLGTAAAAQTDVVHDGAPASFELEYAGHHLKISADSLVGNNASGASADARAIAAAALALVDPAAAVEGDAQSLGQAFVLQNTGAPFDVTEIAMTMGMYDDPVVDAKDTKLVAKAGAARDVIAALYHPGQAVGAKAQAAELAALPTNLRDQDDLTCLAVAIYHEARNQPETGQRAVASVIMQRSAVPHRWGSTPCEVVVPVQFSFLSRDGSFAPIREYEAWIRAKRFAAEALAVGPLPELKAADHYHTTQVRPGWRTAMLEVSRIDDHIFYADPASRG